MTIPFHRDGVSLLVTEPLLVLLNQEVELGLMIVEM